MKLYRETGDCFEETLDLWGGRAGFKNLEIFWIQNRTTINCSFRMIRRIMEISDAVIHLDRTHWTICIITRSILSLIQKLLIDLIHDTRHLSTRFRKCHVVFQNTRTAVFKYSWYFKIISNFTRLKAREITYNNFEISLVVFRPNISYKSCYYLFTLLPAKGL